MITYNHLVAPKLDYRIANLVSASRTNPKLVYPVNQQQISLCYFTANCACSKRICLAISQCFSNAKRSLKIFPCQFKKLKNFLYKFEPVNVFSSHHIPHVIKLMQCAADDAGHWN